MPNLKLQNAVREIAKYYDILTRENINRQYLLNNAASESAGPETGGNSISIANSLIISTIDGALESTTITEQLEDSISSRPSSESSTEKEIETFLQIINKKGIYPKLKRDIKMSKLVGSDDDELRLSAFKLATTNLTPANRDIAGTELFLSAIPTLEFSKAIPFLNIEVQYNKLPINNAGIVQAPSLFRFIRGAVPLEGGTVDQQLVNGLSTIDQASEGIGKNRSLSGMEMFLSPQTLVDLDPANDINRAGPVIDRFQPFMSIEDFKVDITPQVGFFAYRSAELKITLHDRSRLAEIADFIRPDLYQGTELLIEYGWNHPDGSENPYANLINAMRVREKYGITNSSFNFSGQKKVKINLKLFTKGYSDMMTVRLADGEKILGAVEAIRDLEKTIADIRTSASKNQSTNTKEVRGEQMLFGSLEDIGSSLALTKDQIKILKRFLNRTNSNKSQKVRELRQSLITLYGQNGRKGKAREFDKDLTTVIQKRVQKLTRTENDVFLNGVLKNLKKSRHQNFIKNRIQRGYASFGRIMLMFVGTPLAATGKYTDVQFLFYPFNSKAGLASRFTLADFPIEISEFKKAITYLAKRKRTIQVSIGEFIKFMMNQFIDDMSNPGYGLSDVYTNRLDPTTGTRTESTVRSKKLRQDSVALGNFIDKRLRDMGVDGVFKMPQIDTYIETVDVDTVKTGESRVSNRQKTILRIHFLDRVATPYEAYSEIIQSTRDDSLKTLGDLASEDINQNNQNFVKAMAAAEDAGVITKRVTADTEGRQKNVYDITLDARKIKKFLRANLPTITYGTNNTAVKDGSFQTIQEPLLSTVHMLRAGQAGTSTPQGLSPGNIPLRTLPARASLKIMGCPTINYMQQFFVDFDTNTTIDNIYGVNKFTHEIKNGKFESSLELVPLDAYGRYESIVTKVGVTLQNLQDQIDKEK